MRYQQKFWSVDMPKGWTYQEAGHSVAFFNPEGVGAFNVSAYQKSAPVSDLDLRELADSAQLSEVNAGTASGFACRLVQSNEFLMKWWLRSANVMVLATYNCNVEDQGTEEAQISHLLASIEIT
jgi:hypothetical protein